MTLTFLPWHHHPAHPDVVVPVRADPAGRRGPTPMAARGPRWRTVAPGWFVPADVDPSPPDQRIVEAAVHLGREGAVTGWAALRWRGARWSEGVGPTGEPLPVVLATGDHGPRPRPGLVVAEEQLLPREIEVVDGLRLTTVVRSVLHVVRFADSLLDAVQALDMACYDDLVSLEESAEGARLFRTRTGIPQGRAALALADENAWSPTEVTMRLLWTVDACLPRPLANAPVFGPDGRHLVTPDLLDPVHGVVGEYDGSAHRDRVAHGRDVRRDELYRRLGLEEVVMTASDLQQPRETIERLHAAYERAAARPPGPRAWTADPPPWWRSTRTVAQRRALSDGDRRRLLGYRAA